MFFLRASKRIVEFIITEGLAFFIEGHALRKLIAEDKYFYATKKSLILKKKLVEIIAEITI